MTAVLTGHLTGTGQIALIATAGDDWDLQLMRAPLGTLTAQRTFPRDAAGQPMKDVLLVPCTWPVVVQLGHAFSRAGTGVHWEPDDALTDWIAAEAARRRGTPPPLPEDACPPWLKPYDYQREDAAAIAAAGKALLLHEPGMGKTAIAILAAEARRLTGQEIFPMIIVVPSWVVGRVWTDHIATWAPGWPEPVLHRGPDRREALARLRRERHQNWIAITTYATLRLDAKTSAGVLPRCDPATVIGDEIHLAGNDRSAQSQAWQRLARHARTVLGASGTLVTHSAKNVYPVVAGLDAASFPSWDRFKPRYMATRKPDGGQGEDIILGLRPEMEAEFFACLDGQLIRRPKADVLDQLPPKIYSVRHPEMPAEWRHAYDTMRDQMLAELPDGGILPVMYAISKLQRLSQLASSAADVEITMEPSELTGEMVPRYHVTLKRPSWKSGALLGLLAERDGMPTVVFTESRQLAMIAGEDALAAGLRTGFVTGTGDGPDSAITRQAGYRITERTKDAAVAAFQAGRLDVLVCTAGAGALGITLTASNCCALLQRSWELDKAIQPEDRQHRPGSEIHDHVEIIDFVTDKTVDEYRRQVLRGKAGQWAQVARDPRILRELFGGLK